MSGATRDVKHSTGHQVVRLATTTDGDVSWLMSLPHVTVTRPGEDYTELRVDAAHEPAGRLAAAVRHGGDVLRFEVADPSLEEVFVERVGAIDKAEQTLAAAGAQPMTTIANIVAVTLREVSGRERCRERSWWRRPCWSSASSRSRSRR